MKRPKIVIPEINQNVSTYIRAALAAGMEPIAVSRQTEQEQNEIPQDFLDYAEFNVEEYDGLLLPGGGDIDPARFGQENHGSHLCEEAVDELQFAILDDFVKSKKPVLGICKGIQVINVYFGGTLIQHIPTSFRHIGGEGEREKVHFCIAEQGSWLEELYGTRFAHNSIHHQAVDRLGDGLVADSRCPEDGVVEALHHTSLPVFGLQWHPERMCLEQKREDTVNGLPVMQFFCRVCGGEPEKYAGDTKNE